MNKLIIYEKTEIDQYLDELIGKYVIVRDKRTNIGGTLTKQENKELKIRIFLVDVIDKPNFSCCVFKTEDVNKICVPPINDLFPVICIYEDTYRFSTLEQFTPKMPVIYSPVNNPSIREYGKVSSVNEQYVFVKFDEQVNKLEWDDTGAQACNPNDLMSL